MDDLSQRNREFLKSSWGLTHVESDQQAGRPQPPLQKPAETSEFIELPAAEAGLLAKPNLHACLLERRSHRQYSVEAIAVPELSYLLWATQGVEEVIRGGYATRRTVPSGGARHTFETYVLAHRVSGLEPGVCRYLPLTHQLVRLNRRDDLPAAISHACADQPFVAEAAAVFVWCCVPYRAEWRYGPRAHKNILLDAGHVCENLYLACEALGLGTCAVAAYDQRLVDAVVGVDGQDEFAVYLAAVGKR